MKYRPDIDGLRSIAILPIVLFHFGVYQLAGGFVGVDVFFVISGYLITQLLVRELENKEFSYCDFLVRRLRRLFPALAFTLIVTFAFGYAIFLPNHFIELTKSSLSAIFSVSNFFFWYQTGYFDREAIVKPLLHTWSLAVEEQFYLVWPMLLLALTRFFTKEWRMAWVVVIGVVSLIAAEAYISKDSSAVFFFTPFRVTEFAIGGFLALSRARAPGPIWAHVFSLVGLSAIAVSSITYSESMRFPGVSALVPCLGAALIILAGPNAVVNRAIAQPPFKYIGQISYSLYLIHWPIVVYYSYLFLEPKEPLQIIALTLFSTLVAATMYQFVELPFRAKRSGDFIVSNRAIAVGTIAGMSALTCVLLLPILGIVKQRTPPELVDIYVQLEQGRVRNDEMVRFKTCHASGKTKAAYLKIWGACLPTSKEANLAVLGDSHAADLWAGLNLNFPHAEPLQFTGGGCSWITPAKLSANCVYLRSHQLQWIKANKEKVSNVIYTQRGQNLMSKTADGSGRMVIKKKRLTELRLQLEQFAADTGRPVFFWGPRPEFHPGVETIVARSNTIEDINDILPTLNLQQYVDLNDALEEEFAKSIVKYIPVTPSLCSSKICELVIDKKYVVTYDFAHWTPEGARYVVEKVVRERKLSEVLGLIN